MWGIYADTVIWIAPNLSMIHEGVNHTIRTLQVQPDITVALGIALEVPAEEPRRARRRKGADQTEGGSNRDVRSVNQNTNHKPF